MTDFEMTAESLGLRLKLRAVQQDLETLRQMTDRDGVIRPRAAGRAYEVLYARMQQLERQIEDEMERRRREENDRKVWEIAQRWGIELSEGLVPDEPVEVGDD